ncbi:exosortase C-terminal domain/associated protein EpsI [Desulforhopalus sp. 52FAK]
MTNNKNFIILATLLFLCAALVLTITRRGEPIVLKTNLENLPMQIAGYQGEQDSFSESVYDTLDADLHIYRHYTIGDETPLSLYIGYYGTIKGGRTGHNPYACLPGAGWGILDTGTVRVFPSYKPAGVDVNFVVAGKGETNNIMLHWYQSAGTKILATGLEQNFQRFIGRVVHNRNDGAYIQVNSLANKKEIPSTKDKLANFVQEVMELLPQHWPEEG